MVIAFVRMTMREASWRVNAEVVSEICCVDASYQNCPYPLWGKCEGLQYRFSKPMPTSQVTQERLSDLSLGHSCFPCRERANSSQVS
jgi:hypothetical protein